MTETNAIYAKEPKPPKRQDYVVGFLFRNNLSEVALIKKDRPAWQAGHLNGIGGKIEEGETPYAAMAREFAEEAGVIITEWWEFCTLTFRGETDPSNGGGRIHFFKSEIETDQSHKVKTQESEEVGWYPTDAFMRLPHISNLKWLIPMAKENIEATAKTF